MQFVYSPLEQFEPIPFITFYLSNINFSITSISIMFFYIFFILVFFINGYVFQPSFPSNISTSNDKNDIVFIFLIVLSGRPVHIYKLNSILV